MEDSRPITLPVLVCAGVFELPGVQAAVAQETWVVVALVEVLEDAGEHLWLFVGEVDPATGRVGGSCGGGGAGGGKERGDAENVLVGGEEAFLGADGDGYHGRGGCAGCTGFGSIC